jgi:hypothetical protein
LTNVGLAAVFHRRRRSKKKPALVYYATLFAKTNGSWGIIECGLLSMQIDFFSSFVSLSGSPESHEQIIDKRKNFSTSLASGSNQNEESLTINQNNGNHGHHKCRNKIMIRMR